MSLVEITPSLRGDVAIIKLAGILRLGSDLSKFHGAIEKYLSQGVRRFVMDLSELTYMDTVGFGEFVGEFTHITSSGGLFAISAVTPKIAGLLKISNLNTLFEAFATADEAARELEGRSVPALSAPDSA